MELTKSIRRQFKRYLGIDNPDINLSALSQSFSTNLDAENFFKRLPAFLEAVNLAYSDYDDKLKLSSRSLEISSLELNNAYRKLEQLIASTNAMMDGLGQGLLFFDRDGTCSNVFSKICLDFFGSSPEGKNVGCLLQLTEQEKIDLELWLDAVFDAGSAMDISDLYDMAPQSFKGNGRILRLEYRAMKDNRGKLISVLMIATDITQEEIYNRERAILEDHAAMIVAIASNRNSFIDFLLEVEEFIQIELENLWNKDAQTLGLRLHTYKGLASSFYLSQLAQQLHELENLLALKKTISDAHRDDQFRSIIKQIVEAKNTAEKLFGGDLFQNGKVKVVRQEVLDQLQELARHATPEIRRFFEQEFLNIPLSQALDPFVREIKRLCSMQQKTSPKIIITGGDISIPEERFRNLLASFIHAARNIVDHGLELPADRIKSGKEPRCCISVAISEKDQILEITFSDDGKGIDPEKLWHALKKRGLPEEGVWTSDNILQSVFLPSVSTSEDTTMLSGRGVGLASIYEEAKKLSGTAEIQSEISKGTSLKILIPLTV